MVDNLVVSGRTSRQDCIKDTSSLSELVILNGGKLKSSSLLLGHTTLLLGGLAWLISVVWVQGSMLGFGLISKSLVLVDNAGWCCMPHLGDDRS